MYCEWLLKNIRYLITSGQIFSGEVEIITTEFHIQNQNHKDLREAVARVPRLELEGNLN